MSFPNRAPVARQHSLHPGSLWTRTTRKGCSLLALPWPGVLPVPLLQAHQNLVHSRTNRGAFVIECDNQVVGMVTAEAFFGISSRSAIPCSTFSSHRHGKASRRFRRRIVRQFGRSRVPGASNPDRGYLVSRRLPKQNPPTGTHHATLRSFILNPLFERQSPFILREVCRRLYAQISYS